MKPCSLESRNLLTGLGGNHSSLAQILNDAINGIITDTDIYLLLKNCALLELDTAHPQATFAFVSYVLMLPGTKPVGVPLLPCLNFLKFYSIYSGSDSSLTPV